MHNNNANHVNLGFACDTPRGLLVPTIKNADTLTLLELSMPALVPLDYTDIIASIKKTGRVVLASDACARGSFLNEIAQNIGTLCFDYLDAPPVVIGARNWITPPHEFDKYFFPYSEWILDAINARLLPLPGYVSKITPDDQEVMRRCKMGV